MCTDTLEDLWLNIKKERGGGPKEREKARGHIRDITFGKGGG